MCIRDRFVAVHKFQLAESWKNQFFLHLFHFAECGHIPAHIVKAHNGDAVVGAAYAVVEVLFTAEVGAPLGKKLCVSQPVSYTHLDVYKRQTRMD